MWVPTSLTSSWLSLSPLSSSEPGLPRKPSKARTNEQASCTRHRKALQSKKGSTLSAVVVAVVSAVVLAALDVGANIVDELVVVVVVVVELGTWVAKKTEQSSHKRTSILHASPNSAAEQERLNPFCSRGSCGFRSRACCT